MKPAWAEALAGATRMGIPPHRFWQLSLAEWRALTRVTASRPIDRAALDALRQTYPDPNHDR